MEIIFHFFDLLKSKIKNFKREQLKKQFGHCGKNVIIHFEHTSNHSNIYMYDNTNIFEGFTFINNKGKLIVKENSGAAQGLTVITDTHTREVGKLYKDEDLFFERKGDLCADVVIEEDVWIGANVTLLPGVVIGRGATVGAGAVVSVKIPPYSVVIGNPAKIVGFNLTPEELEEHESQLYNEEDRTNKIVYAKEYRKHYVDNFKNIMNHMKL